LGKRVLEAVRRDEALSCSCMIGLPDDDHIDRGWLNLQPKASWA
jgi:hypothetical protein